MNIRTPLSQAIACVLAGIMFLNPIVAAAAQLAADAAAGGNTQIGAAGNGVPVVNISAPNDAGLSHNKFTDYNVDQQGLILNNATTKTHSTQLGGIIVGNPNLKGTAASKILNEVTGGSPSQLRGYTEVAGQAAHVIVANPHGITCNGCGFINTPRATLTTGKPILNGGRLQSYDINGGEIVVEGAGLNASNLDRFELITRSAKLNADLHARQLDIVAGRNKVDAETLTASAKADDGSPKPQLAIDSSALGGMYANTIRLIGTEQGVGVKLAGNLAASAGDIQIDANGQLTVAQASAAGNLRAKASDIALTGPAYAGSAAELSSSGQLSNSQSLAAGQHIALNAAQLTNTGIIEAGVNPDNSRNTQGDIALSVQHLRNSGSVLASRNLEVTAEASVNNQNGSLKGNNSRINTAQLTNQQGRILAQQGLTLSGQHLNNANGQIGAGTIQVSGGHLDNRLGLFSAEQTLNFNLASLDNSQQGTLSSRGTLTAEVRDQLSNNNDGAITAADVRLTAGSVDNRTGTLHSRGEMSVAAQQIDSRQGKIAAQSNLLLKTPKLDLRGGQLVGDTSVQLDLQGGQLDNSQGGLIRADQLSVTNLARLNNQGGEISSQQGFTLLAQQLDNRNQGRIISAGLLSLHADQILNSAQGLLSGWQGLNVTGGQLDNSQSGTLSSKTGALTINLNGHLNNSGQGALVSQGNQRISAASLDNRNGIISGQSAVDLSIAGTLDNSAAGLIDAQQHLQFSHTASQINNQSGQINAGSLLLTAKSLDNSAGQLLSQSTLQATLTGALINANAARLASGGDLLLNAASLNNQGGQLASQGSLDMNLAQGDLDNRNQGTLASQRAMIVKVLNGRLLNSNDGLMHSRDRLEVQAQSLDNQLGLIHGETGVAIAVDQLLNNQQGRIQTDTGTLELNAQQINNTSGGILNAVKGWLKVVSGYFDNTQGVAQGQDLSVSATAGIANQQGHLAATTGQANLDTGSALLDNQSGGLYAGTRLHVLSGDLHNGSGKVGAQQVEFSLKGALDNRLGLIEASQLLTLNVASINNQQGRLRTLGQAGATRITTQGLLDNRQGTLETAANDLQLNQAVLLNEGGTVLHVGNGQFLIDLAQLGQAGGHFVTQSVLSINAPDWTLNSSLQARELILNGGQLSVGKNGQLLAVNRLTANGGTWNNQGLIASDGVLNVSLSGRYDGAGRLTSLGELNLSADQINLTTTATINAGGNALLSTNSLNNLGQITAVDALTTRVAALTNQGTLGSAGTLRIESANLLNQGGLIFSGADMNLRVGTLRNLAGDLYSLGNLHIAANDSGAWANNVENVSGSIETAGALTLLASTFSNRRADGFKIEQKQVAGNIYMYADDVCDGKGCEFKYQTWERYEDVITQDAAQASITAGGDFRFTGNTFDNLYSSIASGGDITIDTATFRNQGAAGGEEIHIDGGFYSRDDSKYWAFRTNKDLYNRYNDPNSSDYNPGALTLEQVFESGGYPESGFTAGRTIYTVPVSGSPVASAVIQAAGNVEINASERFDNSVVRRDAGSQSISPRDISAAAGANTGQFAVTSQLPPDLSQFQVNPLTLPGFSLPVGENGLFRLSGQQGSETTQGAPNLSGLGQNVAQVQGVPSTGAPNNSHKYLIETNPALTTLKSFLSSDYLLGLLGFDPDQAQKRLGDGLYEQRLIQQAVVARTGQRYIAGINSDEALFKYLMDNAIGYKDKLQLTVGVGLSAEQVAALTHDIVWLEEAVVNGEKVLVPVLYLAQSNNRLAPNGALIQGQNLSLISGGDLNNRGTLNASGDLAASAKNISNSGLIEAGNRLDLLAIDNIRNAAGGIISGRDVSLTSLTGDVINERSITSLEHVNNNDRIHKDIANNAARIESHGDLAITAGRDLLNTGGAIQAGGDASLTAGRDLNLTAAQEVDSADFQSKRQTGNVTEVTQHGSEISVGGQLGAQAGRDLNIVASQVDAKGDIALSAGRDVLIASAANESHSNTDYKGGGREIQREESSVHQQGSNVSAGGDVLISAGENLTLVASKISAGDEAYLVAGDKLEVLAAYDSEYSLYNEEEKGNFGQKKTQRDEVTDVRAIGSQISAGSDITLLSGGDQKYQGAKLEAGNDISIVSGGSVTFEAVKDLHQESHAKSDSDMAWATSKGEGKTDETLRQSELIAHGNLTIRAVEGLKIDIKHIDQQSVSQTIDAMVQADPNLAWIKEAEQRGDVDWRQVKEIHDSYSYSTSGMGPVTQLIVAIMAAAAGGIAAAGALSSAGVAVGSVTMGAGVGAAGSLAGTAGVSFINNKGNLGQTLDDTFSSDSLKQAAIAGAVGGATAGWFNDWSGAVNGKTVTDLSSWGGVGSFAANQGMQNVTSAALSKALGQEGSFSDALKNSLYNTFAAVGFNAVGDFGKANKLQPGSPSMIALHALMGGMAAEASGGSFATGAAAAGANESLVASLDGVFKTLSPEKREALVTMSSQVVGVLAAALQNPDADSGELSNGAWVAKNSAQYNYLSHEQEQEKDTEIAGCKGKVLCQTGVEARWSMTSAMQDAGLLVGVGGGIGLSTVELAEGLYQLVTHLPETMDALQLLSNSAEFRQQFGDSYLQDLAERANMLEQAYNDAGWQGSVTAGVESGRFVVELVGVLTAIRGGAQLASKLPTAAKNVVNAVAEMPVSGSKAGQIGAIGKLGDGAKGTLNTSLLDELTANGVKFTPENVIATTRSPSGKVVFLETGNSKAGLQHIIEEHGSQFAQMGVSEAQVPGVVMKAVSEGKLVGYQGSGVGRPIYELTINGQPQRIAVTVGDNGFVVGANPKGSVK